MVYNKVRGWTSGRNLPVLNFFDLKTTGYRCGERILQLKLTVWQKQYNWATGPLTLKISVYLQRLFLYLLQHPPPPDSLIVIAGLNLFF